MIRFTRLQQLRHLCIRSRWGSWLVPALCCVPYIASLIWLFSIGQVWIVQIMLAPLLMGTLLILLTLLLARLEFRR